MTRAGYRLSFLLGLLFPLILSPAQAPKAAASPSAESLRGLDGIYVTVEPFSPEIEEEGPNSSRILYKVRKRLADEGIAPLSRQSWFLVEGSPYLYVNTHVLRLPKTGEFIYFARLFLRQDAYPIREPERVPGAITWWSEGRIGITPRAEKIEEAVLAELEAFIKAFLSVNPR